MTLRPALCLITTILIFKTTTGHAQSRPLNRRVTLEVKDTPLEILLDKIQQEYQLKLVYGTKNFPDNQLITIRANNISLRHFLDRLCTKTGLTYKVVDDYVIFEYKVLAPAAVSPESQPKVIVVSEKLILKQDTTKADSLPTDSPTQKANKEQSIVIRELTDLDSITTPLPTGINMPIMICKRAEVRKPKPRPLYRVAVYASYDHHLFHFNTLPDKNQEYKLELSSSFGSSFSIFLSRKVLAGFGLMYSSKNFTYHRNFRMLNLNDAVSIPDITSLSFTYIEIPFEIEYRVIRYNKLKVNLCPGIDAAFLFDKEERTTYLTQGKPLTEYFINETNSFLWGPQAAVRVEYPLIRSFSFFISPRYIHYIKPVNEATMHSGNDLFRLQAGIQLNIKKS